MIKKITKKTKAYAPRKVEDILAERKEVHGDYFHHAELAQSLKRSVREFANKHDKQLTPQAWEALDMILHKVARVLNGNPMTDDHWADIAGYAECNRRTIGRTE